MTTLFSGFKNELFFFFRNCLPGARIPYKGLYRSPSCHVDPLGTSELPSEASKNSFSSLLPKTGSVFQKFLWAIMRLTDALQDIEEASRTFHEAPWHLATHFHLATKALMTGFVECNPMVKGHTPVYGFSIKIPYSGPSVSVGDPFQEPPGDTEFCG